MYIYTYIYSLQGSEHYLWAKDIEMQLKVPEVITC